MRLLGVLHEKGSIGHARRVAIRLVLLSGLFIVGLPLIVGGAAMAARPANTVSSSAPAVAPAAGAPAVITPVSAAVKPVADPDKKPFEDSGQVLMQADDLKYDRDTKIVTARHSKAKLKVKKKQVESVGIVVVEEYWVDQTAGDPEAT